MGRDEIGTEVMGNVLLSHPQPECPFTETPMEDYEPELGQMFYGQTPQRYDCPELLKAALWWIERELDRVLYNTWPEQDGDTYDRFDHCPFHNNSQKWECPTFKVHAYSWVVAQDFNFEWRDVRVSWYKRFGRGMSVNREVTPDEIGGLLQDCLTALETWEEEHSSD